MVELYGKSHRKLQDHFDSRKMADRLEEMIVKKEFDEDSKNFIQSRDMFFLSTIDHNNRPTVSYKGGEVGFVKIVDNTTLAFPSFDGNGMFMSMGNIEERIKIGMLFVDFETPQRLRLRGEARCLREGSLLDSYPGANLVVEVSLSHVWVNCPRYVHRMQSIEKSPYLPGEDGKALLALWKRVDLVQDVLGDEDRSEAESLGLITIEEYEACVASGKLL